MIAQSFDLTDKEFHLFKEIIYRETGIHMSDKKKKLIVARLSKRLRALDLHSFTQYYEYLNDSPDSDKELVNLIHTNPSDFDKALEEIVLEQEQFQSVSEYDPHIDRRTFFYVSMAEPSAIEKLRMAKEDRE